MGWGSPEAAVSPHVHRAAAKTEREAAFAEESRDQRPRGSRDRRDGAAKAPAGSPVDPQRPPALPVLELQR